MLQDEPLSITTSKQSARDLALVMDYQCSTLCRPLADSRYSRRQNYSRGKIARTEELIMQVCSQAR